MPPNVVFLDPSRPDMAGGREHFATPENQHQRMTRNKSQDAYNKHVDVQADGEEQRFCA
jgi:predicted double-glycine peptidase